MEPSVVEIGKVKIGGKNPLVMIAGPCVIEDLESTLSLAKNINQIARQEDIPFIFKASYDKANRSSISSFRGPGLRKGLEILSRIKEEVGVPILSDVHSPDQVESAAKVLDVIQIPAFLCRQTDLVLAVAKAGKPVNVKKGQFLAPWDIQYVIEKILTTDNHQILLTERGSTFGYNNLVADMRSLVIMRKFNFPVVFDATHSLQLPGGAGKATGGQPELIPYLARGAVAVGCDGIFLEVHHNPAEGLSDSSTMLQLAALPELIPQLKQIDQIVSAHP
jgi:2-dehydro-3-deoxyphosphooctonate aldolase (KDO 8-P synthase)